MSGYNLYTKLRQAAAVLAIAPAALVLGGVLIGWTVLARVAEARERRTR